MTTTLLKNMNSEYICHMHTAARDYVVKEYGVWSVLIVSTLIGLGVSRDFSWQAIYIFLALSLLVNSKQALTPFSQQAANNRSLGIFFAQVFGAAGIFIAVCGNDVILLAPLTIFPVAYFLTRWLKGEHFVVTELLGFVSLSLAAVVMKFLFTGGLDVRLFVAVAFYFMAAVFKVKALLHNRIKDKILSILYVGIAVLAYRRMHIPLLILLPFLDNLLVFIVPHKAKLHTTGWIEVVKSIVALILFMIYY